MRPPLRQTRAVAAIAHALAGNEVVAERWASEIRRNDRGFTQDTFFKAFPFRDEQTRAAMQAALDRLKL